MNFNQAHFKKGPENNASLPPTSPLLHNPRFFMIKWAPKKKKMNGSAN